MAKRYPPTARMLRPVFWILRGFGALLMVTGLWVAWLLLDSDEPGAAAFTATAAVSFFVATLLNPLSRGFRIAFGISFAAIVVLGASATRFNPVVLILLLGVVGLVLLSRRFRLRVDPDSVRPLPADEIMRGAEESVQAFRDQGWRQIGAVGFDILGRTVAESVLIPPTADRYALVTDVVMTVTSEIDDMRRLVTRNSAVSLLPASILSNDLEAASPRELVEGHQRALHVLSKFGAEPVPLVLEQLVTAVVEDERASLVAGPIRRSRHEPAGPIDESAAAERRIRSWLGTPTLD